MKRSPTSHIERLLAIAGELEQIRLPQPLMVFGSMAAGAARPGDIDVVCDLQGQQELPSGSLSLFLSVCRRHYGWVDAFVLTGSGLLVRSDEATSWVRAKNAAGLKQAMANAVPLAEVIELYRSRLTGLNDVGEGFAEPAP